MSVGPALFRQEAIEFQQRHRRWGNVAALQPVSTKIVAWLLAVSATAILFFLLVAQYSRKEVAVGYLTPTTGTAKIFRAAPRNDSAHLCAGRRPSGRRPASSSG